MSDVDPLDDRTLEAAVGDETPALPSLPVRFVQVFVSPGELFSRLKDRPAFWGPLLLGGLLIGLGTYLLPVELTLEVMRQQFIERGQDVPSGLEDQVGLIRLAGAIAGPIFGMIMTVVLSGVVTLIFTFLLGGEGRFKQYLSIVSHAGLIGAVSYVALVPLRISAGDPQLLLSVGTLLPIGGEGYLGSFLGLIDLFGIWTWVVVGLGVSTITKQQSWGSAASVLMMIPLGLAALFAIFV